MKTYKNPFLLENQWSENECGDPFIMRFNGLYYLYCSSAGNYIKCWTSEDLVNFLYIGSVCDEPIIEGAYAPEVCYIKGRFYMITSPIGSGHYLLEADKPTGPFRIISDNYGLLIDGSFFIDDDGKQYMLRAGHQGIVIHSMPTPNEIDVNGETIPESFLNHWTEGPMIIKRNGYYYLTYTGNHLHSKGYRIAYSVSETLPGSGYVNISNRTLLLETGPEFHAIGHSSSFLAPDLDSYCIAYHTFDLDSKPHRRSMNIDRLFFNGTRMYCNPIWWEQATHKMPDFYCRGEQELSYFNIEERDYLITPNETPKAYTAELNVDPKGKEVCFIYGLKNGRYGSILLKADNTYEITEDATIINYGTLNSAISFEGNLTLRIAKKLNCSMDIYINQMFRCSYQTNLEEGYIGILKQDKQEIGFVGYSSSVEGQEDNYAGKAIPGRFDAVHCEEELDMRVFKDNGMKVYSAFIEKDKNYTYSVNAKQAGYYKVIARVKSSKDSIKLQALVDMKVTYLKASLSGVCDEEGYEMISMGVLNLSEGIQKIIISAESEDVTIDFFEFILNAEMKSGIIIENGNLATDRLQIHGHKGFKSMIHKYSGFTCAENAGMAIIGEAGMSDYNISTIINRNNKDSGDVSIFVRVTKESWFPAQVKESLFGYRIRVSGDGIRLYREAYSEELLAYYSKPSFLIGLNIIISNM